MIIVGTVALISGESFGGAIRTSGTRSRAPRRCSSCSASSCRCFFFINFLILFGPLLFFGIQQIKGYEPGDADWGVKLDDVRGQAEAKEEITPGRLALAVGRGVREGGRQARARPAVPRRARAPARRCSSKAIATGFNCPFVTIPGSGFAQMFIGHGRGHRALLARKAKKLARKWGGQCIVFIDEIDAVGMRRAGLGTARPASGRAAATPASIHDALLLRPDAAR